jgi:hypothetical protein
MKIRMGFVSNSSSSSYTCDVCNRTESGWDLGLSEAEMNSCVNGHTFCTNHVPEWELSWEDKREMALNDWYVGRQEGLVDAIQAASTEESFTQLAEKEGRIPAAWEEAESGYDVPAKGCPICSFGKVHERDAFLYLLKVAGREEADLLAELKEKFGSYEGMKQWLKE